MSLPLFTSTEHLTREKPTVDAQATYPFGQIVTSLVHVHVDKSGPGYRVVPVDLLPAIAIDIFADGTLLAVALRLLKLKFHSAMIVAHGDTDGLGVIEGVAVVVTVAEFDGVCVPVAVPDVEGDAPGLSVGVGDAVADADLDADMTNPLMTMLSTRNVEARDGSQDSWQQNSRLFDVFDGSTPEEKELKTFGSVLSALRSYRPLTPPIEKSQYVSLGVPEPVEPFLISALHMML